MAARSSSALRRLQMHARAIQSQSGNASLSSEDVIVKANGACRVVTLDRPKALNALTMPMIQQLTFVFKYCENNPHVGSILLKGADTPQGKPCFCAGGDVRGILATTDDKFGKEFFRQEYVLNHLTSVLKTPYISVLNGVTMGGGAGLSLHGRYRVVTENTLFAMPECAIGLVPDVGGTYFLSRLAGNLGRYIGLTGARLDAADLLNLGLGDYFIPSYEIPFLEDKLTSVYMDSKLSVGQVLQSFAHEPKKLESKVVSLQHEIDKVFGMGSVEEIMGALRNLGDKEWAKKALASLEYASPLALKLTLRLIDEAKKKTLAECLQSELRVTSRSLSYGEFREGVRAMLVDKDKAPKWKFPSLEQVEESELEKLLEPLPDEEALTFDMSWRSPKQVKNYYRNEH